MLILKQSFEAVSKESRSQNVLTTEADYKTHSSKDSHKG